MVAAFPEWHNHSAMFEGHHMKHLLEDIAKTLNSHCLRLTDVYGEVEHAKSKLQRQWGGSSEATAKHSVHRHPSGSSNTSLKHLRGKRADKLRQTNM